MVTSNQVHNDHAENIAQNLNQAGVPTSAADVKPTTADTPFPLSEEIKKAGGVILGDDELEYGLKDLQYMAEADLKQGDKIRITESKHPLKMLMNRFLRKKKDNKEVIEK